jgi:hypothetical protein
LKELFMKSELEFLQQAAERGTWDPPSLFRHTRSRVIDLVVGYAEVFGSAGKAA